MGATLLILALVAAISVGASVYIASHAMIAFNVCVFVMFITEAICTAIKESRR